MSTTIGDCTVDAWTETKGSEPFLSVRVSSKKELPHTVKIGLSRSCKPSFPFIGFRPRTSSNVKAPDSFQSGGATWTPTKSTGNDDYGYSLARGEYREIAASKSEARTWHLDLAIALAADAKDPKVEMTLGKEKASFVADSKASFVADSKASFVADSKPPTAHVKFYGVRDSGANEYDTHAVELGTTVTLKWELPPSVTKATLLGYLPDGKTELPILPRDKDAPQKKEQAVIAVSALQLYRLVVEIGGSQQTFDWFVGVAQDDRGFKLVVRPPSVFPGGPASVLWGLWGAKNLQFKSIGSGAFPLSDKNPRKDVTIGRATTGSLTIDWGPTEGEWQFDATADLQGGRLSTSKGGAPIGSLRAEMPTLLLNEGKHKDSLLRGKIYGLAAGRFHKTRKDGGSTADAFKDEVWIAAAGEKGLEVRVRSDNNKGSVKRVIAGRYLGVGSGPSDTKERSDDVVLAVRAKVGGGEDPDAGLVEFELPNVSTEPKQKEVNGQKVETNQWDALTAKKTTPLPAAFVQGDPVRVLSLGKRVFVLGKGVACFYERGSTSGGVEMAPVLADVAGPSWDVVVLAAEPSPKETEKGTLGWFFALHKGSGRMFRLAVERTQEDGKLITKVLPPAEVASPNGDVVPLDLLQAEQYSLSKTPRTAEQLKGADPSRAKEFEGAVQTDPKSWTTTRPAVDARSVLMVVDGALVARSVIVDQRNKAKRIQDRAYDPRLDIWVRCGHPFPGAGAEERSFAWVVSTKTGLPAELFWRDESGAMWHHSGRLLATLGFFSADVQPRSPTTPKNDTWLGGSFSGGKEWKLNQCLLSKDASCALMVTTNGLERESYHVDGTPPSREVVLAVEATFYAKLEDGALVIYSVENKPLWRSTEHGGRTGAGAKLELDDKGGFRIVDEKGKDLWHTPRWLGTTLTRADWMLPGDWLQAGNIKFEYTKEGALKLSGDPSVQWELPKQGGSPHHVEVNPNGNLTVHANANGEEKWGAHELGGAYDYRWDNAKLHLSSDGTLAVTHGEIELWHAPRELSHKLPKGSFMVPGDRLVNGPAKLEYTKAGDLAWTLLVPGSATLKWSPPIPNKGKGPFRVRVNDAGHLVVLHRGEDQGQSQRNEAAQTCFSSADCGGVRGWNKGGDLILLSTGWLEVRSEDGATELWHAPTGAAVRGSITYGQFMVPGDKLVQGLATFEFRSDGKLVASAGGKIVFQSFASDPTAWRAFLETSGNFVVQNQQGQTIFTTAKYGGPKDQRDSKDSRLSLDKDGSLSIHSSHTYNWRRRKDEGDSLPAGSGLECGSYLEGGGHRLVMEHDGDLVLYAGDTEKWRANSDRVAESSLNLMVDGVLVIASPPRTQKGQDWSSVYASCGEYKRNRYYDERGAKLKVDANGFHVESEKGTIWYRNDITGSGTTKGKIKQVNRMRCRIRNDFGYLHAVGVGYRVYVSSKNPPDHSIWIKHQIDGDLHVFENESLGGLLMAGLDEYADRRNKVELAADDGSQDRLFNLEYGSFIQSVARNRYVYGTHYRTDSNGSQNVLWWNAGALDGTPPEQVGRFAWTFDPV